LLDLSTVDRDFDHQSGQTKNYKIGMCCFSSTKEKEQRLVASVRIMCPSSVTCLLVDWYFNEYHYLIKKYLEKMLTNTEMGTGNKE
jgi:hypothetical protein